ncbi:MAG: AMP-binding protein, partial [Rhodospirillales bacterium]|nr:AMP-binding protein [Rhodospirillales bacterium]
MLDPTDIHALLERGGRDDIAIAAPEREPLTYGGLRDQVGRTGDALGQAGIGPGDRVAIVLPNGPEMAAAFLATAGHATAAPLTPAYRVDEFAFYLEDLRARALILQAGNESAAIEAAKRVGVPIIALAPDAHAGAGTFTLDAPSGAGDARDDGDADNAAMVLHTSGTTSRPKIVPLTGANLCASARNIADWIALAPGDRCLNIMPLFHIHGLMAGVMASLHAGATVICTPGFNALRVFAWLDEMTPTWLTAVPTMHQAILARAARNKEIVARRRLRLLRSSPSSLPAPGMGEPEAGVGAPGVA